MDNALLEMYETILMRKTHREEGSYTSYLFDKGKEKILKKVGEESTEVVIAAMADDHDGLVEDGRVMDLERRHVGAVLPVFFLFFQVGGPREHLAQEQDGQDHADHPEWVGHGGTQCRPAVWQPHLLQGLLRRAERGGVGRCPAQHAHHVRQRDVKPAAQEHGQRGAQQDDTDAQHVQRDSAVAERAEEARRHQREHDDGLYGTVLEQQTVYPFHAAKLSLFGQIACAGS